ncbi:MAG TPA: CPBP family intramembrane glutamic endopeptidase [Hyphomicrobiaceae bacterium]|nr:CPBP family intramembrane glutamic endopeptidase [Hyphomicrobiaceae bacterium]
MDSAPGGHWQQAGGRYRAATPWSASAALAVTVAIIVVAIVVGGQVGSLVERRLDPGTPALRLLAGLAATQGTVIALALLAALVFSNRPRAVLALETFPRFSTVLWALGAMFSLLALYNLAAYTLDRGSVVEDLRPFAGLMRSEVAWLAAIVIGIGAPFSEELLFRGFLQSALARSRIGYFGASLVTTMGWTALHAGYSGTGLLEVFLIGLLLSWLLWRTGTLWVPIICHAVHNSTLLALLAALELPPA